ncbi:polymer-forming cytoskeletal protein [Alicyclobacillus mali (ex Roth et al. 2021)]|uniref:polymer-forming cytoskeletal protein n=1 Tax=Alicyclobacillus mali (ex Roth et al. 2021) TaxID=1123961 RepID=UPI001A8FC30D|nr:polymer-forming cytoskeletal protein [Alicyclobacillus mali (ex Roth et al. 2021)]
MGDGAKPKLTVMGQSSAAGGDFGRVRIMGQAVVKGPLTCEHLRVMGELEARADVSAEAATIMGQATCRGDVTAAKLQVMGALECDGHLSAGVLKTAGEVVVRGNCGADRALIRGALTVEGLFSADEARFRLHGPCRVREMGMGRLTVELPRYLWKSSMRRHGTLEADVIEADEVHLVHTRARVVRAQVVRLGPGCEIECVEYGQSYDAHPDAKVGRVIDAGRPE